MAALTAASSKASTVATGTPMPRQSCSMSIAGPLERSGCRPVPGMTLVTGHGGRAVVEHDDEAGRLVVAGVDQRRDAGVKERGVADHGHRRRSRSIMRLMPAIMPMLAPMQTAALERQQRRQRAERVAADVAHDGDLLAAQHGVDGAVRAARAQDRRTHRQIVDRRRRRRDDGGRPGTRAACDAAGGVLSTGSKASKTISWSSSPLLGMTSLPTTGSPSARTWSSMNGSSSSTTSTRDTES